MFMSDIIANRNLLSRFCNICPNAYKAPVSNPYCIVCKKAEVFTVTCGFNIKKNRPEILPSCYGETVKCPSNCDFLLEYIMLEQKLKE